MLSRIQALGAWGIAFLERLGQAGFILLGCIFRRPKFKRGIPLFIEQVYVEGVLSLPIIIVAGMFIGMVLALQGYNILDKFAAADELGPLVALSVARELGPVVTGLLFAGRAGSALTAEIGLMKATDQLSSMELMAVDPVSRVIAPRLWGGFLSLPLLTIIFSMFAIYGSYLVGVQWIGLNAGSFWSNMQSSVDFRIDILNGVLKSVVFGFFATWIAVYQGYACTPTSEGISHATTRTVVFSSLVILGLDFVLTAMMMEGW
jgi:phospholipid/cholesterol/gamma-HCH transport system permease protein